MMRSLWSGASGMRTQQDNMDVVAHNLANVNTYGGKKVRAEFHDLLYQTLRPAGAESGADSEFPTGLQIGLGDRLAATQRIFTQGNLQSTEHPLDIAIEGDGFFRIDMPDGTTAYTRDGSFKRDSNNRLVTSDGYPLSDNITFDDGVPNDAISISSDGRVSQIIDNVQQQVGQIQIARFVNPAGLISRGHNLLYESDASGAPLEGNPGEEGRGTLLQSVIEMSNVQVVDEMVNMIVAQRAYESNARVVTTSDSMLEIANGLKR